jgi:hypothetical protein
MNGRPDYFLRLVPMVLAIFLVWPPSVLVQEKKPSPAAQPSNEKKDPLDVFLAERDKKEALAKALCQNLPHWSDMAGRYYKNPDTWLEADQDREFQDPKLFSNMLLEVTACRNELHSKNVLSYTEIETLSTNFKWMRIAYLENRELKTEAQMHGLVAKYNDLVADYNEVVTLATLALLHPSPAAPSALPWLKPTAPIRGPVVCKGSTIALGQGMTSIYVNCN